MKSHRAALQRIARRAPRGLAVVSAERVRLLEWTPERLEELQSWELTISKGWRERKAPRAADPARSQGISAAGREQFGERLNDNRRRFLGECGQLASKIGSGRDWKEILAFGHSPHVADFCLAGGASPPTIEPGAAIDLISSPQDELEAAVAEAIERLDAERDRRLVERALEQAHGGRRGIAGRQETSAALDEGRVEHLIMDVSCVAQPNASAAIWGPWALSPGNGARGQQMTAESLVERALESGGEVTAVSGAAAELLTPVEGAAALLRY